MKSEDLPALGMPTIPTFIARALPSAVPERRARGDVGRVVDAEVEPREAHGDRRAVQRPGGSSRPKARAAAKLDVACEDGNERPVGVAIRCGRSSITGRRRPIASLIEVEVT